LFLLLTRSSRITWVHRDHASERRFESDLRSLEEEVARADQQRLSHLQQLLRDHGQNLDVDAVERSDWKRP